MIFQQIRGATARITFGGKKFLLDPFFAPKCSHPPVPSRWNTNPNPLVELPLSIEDIIQGVNACIVTHMHHFDHFDPVAAKNLPKNMIMFVQSDKENEDMRQLGFADVRTLTPEGVKFDGISLYRTDALHGDGTRADYYYAQAGVPKDACGVVFKASGEKTLYAAGDTIWFAGVRDAIAKFQPEVIVLNAAEAQMYDGTPILMGLDSVAEVAKAAPDAIIVATHLDAVNHARISRADMRAFARQKGLEQRLLIPEDGEEITL